eukprot:1156014-Pelagomonas_calceolata.AAC.15
MEKRNQRTGLSDTFKDHTKDALPNLHTWLCCRLAKRSKASPNMELSSRRPSHSLMQNAHSEPGSALQNQPIDAEHAFKIKTSPTSFT